MKLKGVVLGLVVCSIFSFALQGVAAKKVKGKRNGTAILHFMVKANMVGAGVESNAVGSLSAKQNKQGNANNQRLNIALGGLQGDTAYGLFASLRTDTNLTEVGTLTTDANGDALVKFVKKNNGKGNAGGVALPDALNPLANILALAIVNAQTQTVLSVDLTQPDQLQYLVKRCLDNDQVEPDAAAALRIKATQSFVQFRLLASGLVTNATYFLNINDTILDSRQSDSNGDLEFDGLPGAPDVLDIDSIAVQNSSSNNVLSTTLP